MIVISGYYGFDNLGDEAILQALCADLCYLGFQPQELVVLSRQPEKTQKAYGVQALDRYDLKSIWSCFAQARCLISGGGSLLQDVTSFRSIPYYLGLVELAHLRKVPIIMYGQGIGPVQSRFFRSWVKRAFRLSASSTVRDQESYQFLRELGLELSTISMTADPVFGQELVQQEPNSQRLLFNLRPYQGWPRDRERWLSLLNEWRKQGFMLEFIPIGPGDREIGHSLQGSFPGLKLHPTLTLSTYKEVYRGARFCLSMRLHGLIFSALEDVQPLGLNYDPKVEAISGQLQIPFWNLEEIKDLDLGLTKVLEQEERYRAQYQVALQELNALAKLNRASLAQILK